MGIFALQLSTRQTMETSPMQPAVSTATSTHVLPAQPSGGVARKSRVHQTRLRVTVTWQAPFWMHLPSTTSTLARVQQRPQIYPPVARSPAVQLSVERSVEPLAVFSFSVLSLSSSSAGDAVNSKLHVVKSTRLPTRTPTGEKPSIPTHPTSLLNHVSTLTSFPLCSQLTQ
jgi:hypothetical protein